MKQSIEGTIVSEEEAAVGLGFADVFEFRRWQTEMGHKVAALEARLREAEADRDSYLWYGRRMQVVLEKAAAFLMAMPAPPADLVLAIGVVNGRAVDWGHVLDGWFTDQSPAPAAEPGQGPAQPE